MDTNNNNVLMATLSLQVQQQEFPSLFTNINTLLLSTPTKPKNYNSAPPPFSSTTLSTQNPNPNPSTLLKSLTVLDRSLTGAAAGGIAGAFTYVCLLPIDAVKTRLQTKGASQVYSSALDAAAKIFQSDGVLGFYRGVSAVLVGSATSSAIYFGTCETAKTVLARLGSYPPVLIPPTAGAMGNIVSSAVMVPKELITQRMQAGASGRSWEVMLRIIEKDGILGLYAGYSATLLRNLPAGILSYSSFEYLKAFVLGKTGKGYLEPAESVCCGALAGAISASLTTPFDVVKTRLMTQVQGQGGNKISVTVRQILMEEGWTGMTRGIGPRVLHSACFAALGYFAFETTRLAILHQYIARREAAAAKAGI
ncbi:protein MITOFERRINLIKE 1, chloroplastic [Iris pallida]|uniref:Protein MITOFERRINLIKE 1, chloroplastic n=1 Tax=Iris pallida TaxID=29817 RepID=A0AAX6H1J9_IRIPA|nr:protein MITOFERRINLIKE 1, chloroplastic [Iris pallida]